MRNLFKIWLAVGSFLMLAAFVTETSGSEKSKSEPVTFHKTLTTQQANVVVEKVYNLNGLVKTEITLDTTKFGVCDTCSGSFLTALKVNRQLVDSLNKENGALYEKYVESIDLNDELSKVNALVKNQIDISTAKLKK